MPDFNINLFYDIPTVKIDKKKPFYNPDRNIIYFRGINCAEYKYYLEATQRNSNNILERYIIFSKYIIHPECRRLICDNYARPKVIPRAFRNWLQSIYTNESNIDIEYTDMNDDYTAVLLLDKYQHAR